MSQHRTASVTRALAHALWDAEKPAREALPSADDMERLLERAEDMQKWLRIHGAKIVRIKAKAVKIKEDPTGSSSYESYRYRLRE